MTCRHDVKRVAIDPSLLGDDKDMLEDLVAAAFNDAAQGRGDLAGKDGVGDRRHAHAPGMKFPSDVARPRHGQLTSLVEAAASWIPNCLNPNHWSR